MGVATMRVPTIFTAVDRFSQVVDKMTRKTTMFGEAAGAAAMRTSSKFNSAGTTMLTAGTIMGGGIGIAVNEAMKFEKAMSNVSTTIDSTPAIMKSMSDEVLKMSKKIPIPLSQMTDALYDVVSAGIQAKYSMTVLNSSSRLAVAGLGTSKEGVDILTSSINAFNISATKSESIANMVFKAVKYGKTTVSGLAEGFGNSASLIKNSNVELSEFLATTATLTTTGMTASKAQTQVASATIALIKPNKTMQKIFDSLGTKDIPLFIKKNGGLVKTLEVVVNRAKKMGTSLPKAFGRKEGLNAMLSLLGSLRGKFDEINTDMIKGGDTLSQAFNKQNATSAARFQLLKNNLVDLGIKIGNAVLPALNSLMDRISPILEGLTNWAQRNQWLSSTLLYATGILIGLGVAAKITAFLFYGYGTILKTVSFITSAYTTVTELCTVATYLAASGQATLATSLGAVAAGLLATYWPVLLVVAALGGLAYVLSSTSDSATSFSNAQISGLNNSNAAWRNSTNIMQGELYKQNGLLSKSTQVNSKNRVNNILSSYNDRYAQAVVENNNIPKGQSKYSDEALKYAVRTNSFTYSDPNFVKYNTESTSAPKNLAGQQNNQDMSKFVDMFKERTLNINLNDPGDVVKNVDSDKPKGIKVVTTSTKK